jgi:hypothetical protein
MRNFLFEVTESMRGAQRITFFLFLFQTLVSCVILAVFAISNVFGIELPSTVHVLPAKVFEAFPIDSSLQRATVIFNSVFAPLALLSTVSIIAFGMAILGSIGAVLRNPKRYGIVFLIGVIEVLFVLAFLTAPTQYAFATSLKRSILLGNISGYIGFFCIFPLVSLFVTSELPRRE